MKKILPILLLIATTMISAQSKGTIQGVVLDKESSNEPLPFANVFIKGSQTGTTTDFDGVYLFTTDPGTYTLVFSFVGYQKVEVPNIIVKADEVTTLENVILGATEGVSLKEVIVKATTQKESVAALLTDRKKAVEIKTSIGAEELSVKGVGDVAAAVTKVTGISKQEGSGNVFVRGLGDRFNVTTLNGLPLPSNNPSRKNIELGLFSTDILEFIGIDKTYSAQNYGDFGGANIDIISKNYRGKGFVEVGISSGLNSEANAVDNFFLNEGPGFTGFYDQDIPYNSATQLNSYLFSTSWDREEASTPINSSLSIAGGDSYEMGENSRLNFFAVGSFDNNYVYNEGVNRGGINVGNGLANSDFDYLKFSYNTNTTLMGNIGLKLGDNNNLKYNILYLNNTSQSQIEYDGILDREDDAPEGGGFIQRATFERTSLIVHQFLGDHNLKDNITLDWGVSYNYVNNIVPERRQNTLLPLNNNDPQGPKSFRLVSTASENHRFFQNLQEDELSANIATTIKFSKNEDDEYNGKLIVGYSGRFKNVDFEATQFNFQFLNVQNQPVVDPRNIDAYFTQANLNDGLYQIRTFRGNQFFSRSLEPQTYGGDQLINAGYISFEYKFNPKFTLLAGLRGESINQFIDWDTNLSVGDNELNTFEILPALSLKYELNEKQNLKFAASKTYTLPQFKERAPFLFQETINNDSFGNQFLTNSNNYNFDLIWEIFPKKSELISFGVFGKYIENPINTFLVLSAANDISFANTGDWATVFGAELEVRLGIFNNEIEKQETTLNEKLSFGANISYLNSNQELSDEKVTSETNLASAFTNTEAPLQGASDFITNLDLSYYKEFGENTNLRTTLTGNYFSDRIYAIGSVGRGHLVDQGFITLDFITKAQLSKNLSLGINIKNLLNPEIERIQENAEGSLNTNSNAFPEFLTDGPVTVLSYKRGMNMSLSLTYKF